MDDDSAVCCFVTDLLASAAFECFCIAGFGHVPELVAFIAESIGTAHVEVIAEAELALECSILGFFGAPFFEMACLGKDV